MNAVTLLVSVNSNLIFTKCKHRSQYKQLQQTIWAKFLGCLYLLFVRFPIRLRLRVYLQSVYLAVSCFDFLWTILVLGHDGLMAWSSRAYCITKYQNCRKYQNYVWRLYILLPFIFTNAMCVFISRNMSTDGNDTQCCPVFYSVGRR